MQFIISAESLVSFEKTLQIHLDSGCTVVHLQVAASGQNIWRYVAILKKPDGNF